MASPWCWFLGLASPSQGGEQMTYSAENPFPLEAHARLLAAPAPARLGLARRGGVRLQLNLHNDEAGRTDVPGQLSSNQFWDSGPNGRKRGIFLL